MSTALCQLVAVLLAVSLSCWPASAQSTVGATADETGVNGTLAAGPVPEQETTLEGNGTAAVTEGSVLNVTWNSDNHSATNGSEVGQSTLGIPDVTATSQVILLQTAAPSVGAVTDGSPTTGTSPAETSPLSADISNTSNTVADAPPVGTTTTSVVAASASSTVTAVTTEPTPGPGVASDGSTTIRWNGTVQPDNGTDDHPAALLLLTFNGTCDYDTSSITGQLEDLERAGAVRIGCESQVRLRMSVSNVSNLDHLVGVLQIRTRGSVMTLSAVEFPDKSRAAGTADEDFVTSLFAGPFSTREIITYAVVGGVFGVAIILVAALLCCKCCCGDRRRKRSQDIPHLTLRLEDYSLTRIPRPNTLFGGGGGASTGLRNGTPEGSRVRQSIDTSVVPIEEEFGSLRRGGLRSFSGRRLGNRDEEDAHSRCSPALTGSTERLARDFGNRQHKRGNENKNFRF